MQHFRRFFRVSLIFATLFLLCAASASAADLGVGVVNAGGLRLRAEANTSASILATAEEGELAIVKEDMGDGWYRVDYRTIEGYMSMDYIGLETSYEGELGYGQVDAGGATLNLRSGAGTEFDRVAVLSDGTVVELLGMEKGWFKVSSGDTVGYASSEYILPCLDLEGNRGDQATAASSSLGAQIVAYAKQYLGTPYVWGGNGPNSFDCSGFTTYVYSHFGYSINRTASAQLKNGVSVARSELQAGDLVFFHNGKSSSAATHVGIYIGDGDFIHASSNSYTVEISSLYARNYDAKYVYARRII